MENSIFTDDYNFENDLKILRLYINNESYSPPIKFIILSDEYIVNLNNLINQYYFLDNNIYNSYNNNKNDNELIDIRKILRNEDFNITNYLSIVNEFLNLFESNDYIMNEKLNNIYEIIIKYKSIIESNENNDIIINNINTFFNKYNDLFLFSK